MEGNGGEAEEFRGQGQEQGADDGVSHGLTRIIADGSERPSADRTEGNADSRVTPAVGGLSGKIRPAVERLRESGGWNRFLSWLWIASRETQS